MTTLTKDIMGGVGLTIILIGLCAIASCTPTPNCYQHGDWLESTECEAIARAEKDV